MKVVESRDAFVSVQGTILLGELLHLVIQICGNWMDCVDVFVCVYLGKHDSTTRVFISVSLFADFDFCCNVV